MAKEASKSKKEKKSKSTRSGAGADRKKKKKKKKEKKSDVQRERRATKVQAHEVVDQAEVKVQGKVDSEINTSIPIKLSLDVSPKDSERGEISWASAFAAASKVRPKDSDLDGHFLKAAYGGVTKSLASISQVANRYVAQNAPNSTDVSSERELKRKRSESSNAEAKSNDDGSVLSVHTDDSCLELEGRMIPMSSCQGSSDMRLVLIHKQSGNVYSSEERDLIGKMVKGKVELDPAAIDKMKQPNDMQEVACLRPSFPYRVNSDDHCETPLQSYTDILPLLNRACKYFGRGEKQSMRIYDPYFCNGSVVKHLSSLGFSSVYNKKEDCYSVWKSSSGPPYDIFLTNPPYSEDHIEQLMNHVTSSSFGGKPWFLLMPTYVHKKDYYINSTTNNSTNPCNPFYIVPKKRYVYLPPSNFREKKESDTHKKSSPFVSMWYCWGGNDKRNEELIKAFLKSDAVSDCDLARSKSGLRDLRRGGSKGKRKKARKCK